MMPTGNDRNGDLPSSALLSFVGLTIAITWGIAGAYIFFPAPTIALFGELEGAHPLYFLATWGPGIAGIVLVLVYGGWRGLRAFMSRLLLWRCGLQWWVLLVLGLPLVFMIGAWVKGGPLLASMEDGLGQMLVLAIIMLFLGPVEEFGWRSVAQPILQRFIAPVWAGALVGAVWGLWHLPAFYLSGTVYADWNFPLFMVGAVTLGILVVPVFNASGGSLLLPVIFHWQLIIPLWPDAQPWDTWILVAVTAVIVGLNRKTMLARPGAITRVIPDTSPSAD